LHFLAWRQRSLWPVMKDPEFRLYALVMFGIIAITCGYLYYGGAFRAGEVRSHGCFQTAAVVADNGLVTAGYPDWPPFVVVLLTLGSYFGGCAGSTGGCIKVAGPVSGPGGYGE
jgi:trk system potassium uptake protein